MTVGFPIWLEFSGIPDLLYKATGRADAWATFRKLVELDCARTAWDEPIEISIASLATRIGLSPRAARRACLDLRKQKLVKSYLPTGKDELGLFSIRQPIKPPVAIPAIKQAMIAAGQAFEAGQEFKYLREATEVMLGTAQEIVDLYFNVCGWAMNQFVLDRLTLLAASFPIQVIRATFDRAQKNGVRSIHEITKMLYQTRKEKSA